MVHNNVMRYKVRDVFDDVTKYGTKIKTSQYLEHGKYPIFDQGKDYIAGYTNEDEGIFQKVPVILFGDHTGILKYITRPCFLGADGVKLLKPKDSNIVVKYLFYALNNVNIPDAGYSRHFKWLKEGEIPIPSKEQQSMIVEILDELSYIVQKEKEMLIKFDELVKSRFLELFGDLKLNSKNWKIFSFPEFALIDTQMIHDFHNYEDYPHIGIDSIEKDTGNILAYRTIGEDHVISGKYLFTANHIVYSKIRPNLNKVALPDFDGLCSADAYPILPIEGKSNRYFLAFILRSNLFLSYILAFSNRTNLPKVNKAQIERFRCPLPPIEMQDRFAIFYKQVDKSKMAVQKSLDELETLKKSLMQTYFG